MPEWKPPQQFDFTSGAPAEPDAAPLSPTTTFDFKAPADFNYRDSLYGDDAGALTSAGSYLKDVFNTYMGGAARTVESLGFLAENFGDKIPIVRTQVSMVEHALAKLQGREARPVEDVFDEAGGKLREIGKESSNYWFDKVSDGFTEAMNAGIYDEDFGVTTIVAGAAASLNESMLTMGSGAAAGKLAALAGKVGVSSIAKQAALGSVRAQRIMKYAGYVPAMSGAAAGGLAEGAMAAGASGVAVEEQIMQMDHESLLTGSSRYFDIWEAAQGMPEAERESYAKTTLAEEAAKSVAVSVGLSTAALGAPTGALAGHLGGKAVKGTVAAKTATWLESRVAGQAAVGAAGEASQEFLQEGAQQFLQNLGLREYADSKQSLSQDVLSSAVIGGLVGGVMGGVITPAVGSESRKNARANNAAAGSAPSAATDKPRTGEVEPTVTASRNPILEARITDLLTKVSEAEVPAGEFMKVARWAGYQQEGAAGGRSALEFAKALEQLVETGAAPDDVNAAVGDDFTAAGMLTEAAYKKDEKRFAFEAELHIKPTKEQVLPVLQELGANGANPYILNDGTLVIPQSEAGADGLAAVGKSIEAHTGATIQLIRKANESTARTEAKVTDSAAPAKGAVTESATAPEEVLTSPLAPRTERVTKAVSGMPVSVQSNATVVIEPGMAQDDAQAAIDIAGGVLAATSPENAYREPTDAQKAAGNYPKLPLLFKGNAPGESVRVVIENVPGSKRKSMAGQPKWTRVMRHHYGYIPGTKAADGDPVDIYLGRAAHDADRPIFVIRQLDPKTGMFDEPKVVMGYEGEGEAKAAYLSEYPRAMHDKLFGGITRMDRAQFNAWVKSGATDVAPDPITKQPMLSLRSPNPPLPLDTGRPQLYNPSGDTGTESAVTILYEQASPVNRTRHAVRAFELLNQVDAGKIFWGPNSSLRAKIVAALESYGSADEVLFNELMEKVSDEATRDTKSRPPGDEARAREADARRTGEPVARIEGGPSARSSKGDAGPARPSKRAVAKNFEAWFAGSKVVNDDGSPKVVYHGADAEPGAGMFDEFQTFPEGDWGTFFASDREHAEVFVGGDGEVVEAYLSIKNPMIVTEAMLNERHDQLSEDEKEYMLPRMVIGQFIEEARAAGNDGIIAEGFPDLDFNDTVYIAFEPEQIKSATDNIGTFDPANPSFLASLAPKAPKFHQGKIKPNAVSATAVHYSPVDGLTKLDPSMAGSASAGGERRRMGMGTYGKKAKPGDIARRLYFYEQTGKDLPQRERAVSGDVAYRVRLENLYDFANDPDDIAGVIAETYGPMQMMNIDLVEETINELGYDGFIADPEPGMEARPIVLFGLRGQVPVERVTMPALSLATSSSLLRNLTPAEQRKVTNAVAAKITVILEQLPHADEYAAAAYAGRAKRGWYRKSSEALRAVFGHEAPRFAALLAAMSPQTSVESNLRNALNTWVNWDAAGRPTDRESILDVMAKSVEGKGNEASVLWAWVPNSERALTAEDPIEVMLSGPKVDSFMRNLLGDVQALTLDTWMANFAAFDKMILRGSMTKSDPGKRPTYLAMSARIREAATRLSELTNETWTPSEVQETVWSWAKTLTELADSSGEFRTAPELIADKALTDELIQSTPDFGNLLADPEFGGILEEAGYAEQVEQIRNRQLAEEQADEEQDVGAKAEPFDPSTQLELEQRAARRLTGPRRGGKEVVEDFSDVPFSLARKASAQEFVADIRHQLKQPGYAIITATREGIGGHNHPTNVAKNLALREELDARGIEWLSASGVYKGEDQGTNFVIFTNEATAKELGAKYFQESILTNRGLVYTDGTNKLVPALHAQDMIGESAKGEDFYSIVTTKDGDYRAIFSVGLDFNGVHRLAPAAAKVNSPDNLPDVFIAPGLYSAMYHAIQHEKGVPKLATAKQWSEWLDGAQRRGLFRGEERTWTEIDVMLQKRAEVAERRPTTRVFSYGKDIYHTVDSMTDERLAQIMEEHPDGSIVTIDNAKIAIDDVLSTIEESYPEIEETVLHGLSESERDQAIQEMVNAEMDGYDAGYDAWSQLESAKFVVKWTDERGVNHRADEEFDDQESAEEWIADLNDHEYRVELVQFWSARVRNPRTGDVEIVGEDFDSVEEADEAALERQQVLDEERYDQHRQDFIDQLTEEEIEAYAKDFGGFASGTQYGEWTAPGGENYREILFHANVDYSSPHFDSYADGLLMHARVKDRFEGTQKILFIEEMQSDLQQQAREIGTMTVTERAVADQELFLMKQRMNRSEMELAALIPKAANSRTGFEVPVAGTRFVMNQFRLANFDPVIVVESVRESADSTRDPGWDALADAIEANGATFVRLSQDVRTLQSEIEALEQKVFGAMEPAPFHKSWPEVMLKHLIQYAAQNGYDAVAWTTGKQQADRYRGGVSQVIDTLLWNPEDEADNGIVGYLTGHQGQSQKFFYGFNSDFMSDQLINGEHRPLKDIIGAGLAEEIQRSPANRHNLRVDMIVGGKGMVVQYDQIMPKVVEKLVKKMGGSVTKSDAGLINRTPGGTRAWRVDLSPQMREALSQPMPAYSLAKEHDAAAGRLAEAQAIVDEVASKLRGAPPYTVVGNDAHLPGHSRRQITALGADGLVEGFLDPVSGRVFIVADNVQMREGETYRDAVERVFAEETLGHFGLRAVFGKPALDKLFDQVYRDFKSDPRMRQIVDEYLDTYGDPTSSKDAARRMADEFLAKSNPNDQPSLWSMLVSWVRENLRKMGFVREWNDNDIRNLMERVFDSVRMGYVPSGLQKMSTAMVEFDGTDVSRTTVRDGRGVRHTTERDGERSVTAARFKANILEGSVDSLPAAEVTAFAGSVRDLAKFVGAEGKQRIVASLMTIPEKIAQASGFPYSVEDGALILEIPTVAEKPSGVFSLRNRARGSADVEAILEKSVAPSTSDMSFGQKMQKTFHELTGYFGSSDTWLELKAGWIDSATAIEKLERDQFNGSLLDASESAYKMINLTRNLPQVVAAVAKKGVPIYRDGSFVAVPGRKGLFEIFAPLWKTSDGRSLAYLWEGYAVARRSSQLINERNPDGTSKEKMLSQGEIDKLRELEQQYPEFRKVFDEWQQFRNELLDLAVDRGTMTAETATLWKQNDYVPFFRVNEEEEIVAGIKRKRGLSGQKVTSKRLTGSDRRIQPVIENIVMNTASILEKVYRNEAMNRTVALADGVAMVRAPNHMEAVKLSNADIARQLVKAGLFVGDDSNNTPEQRRAGRLLRDNDINYAIHAVERMSDEQREAWTTFFRPARPEGNDIVSVMVAGKPVYYRVFDPLVLRGILDMTPTNFGGLMDVMGGAKRLLTTMVTLDPGFMIANYQRDTLSAWTTVNEDFTPFSGAIGDAVSVLTDDSIMERMAMAGGMVGGFYNPTQDFGDVMQRITGSGGVVVNGVRASIDAYRKIGMVSEQVNRVAIARAVLRRGGSIAEAAYQAQDVMNFSQHGDAVAAQILIRTVPFLNARIQGLYRLWKGMKGLDGADPKRARLAFMMKFAWIFGASMLLALRNADDERYEKLTDDQKDIYWHIFIGEHHFAIPKPFEVGVLSATIPERIVRRLRGQDRTRDTMHSMERALFETFAFNPIPQLFKPMVEQWANRTFFGQRPIVGQDIDNLEPVAQYNPWTSETARGVATVVDQVVPDPMKRYTPGTLRSPARLEHAMRAYMGTVGSYMFQLSDAALRQGGLFPDAPAMRDVRDVPVLGSIAGRFYRGDSELEGRSKYQDDLYEALREADAAYSTVNAYINRGEIEKAQKLVDAKIDPLTVRPVLHAFREEASNLNTLQRQVMSSDMSPEEKRELLDEIARSKTRLMREAGPYLGMMDW